MQSQLATVLSTLGSHALRREVLRDLGTGELLTVAELLDRRDALVRDLARLRRGQPIALAPTSAVEAVVGVLAALQAGRPFVPIDPSLPRSTAQEIVARTGAEPVGTQPRLTRAEGSSRGFPAKAAYAIATSGTTGEPKIAVLSASGLAEFVYAVADDYRLTADDVVLQGAAFGFDVWLEEVLPALLCGARIVCTGRGWRISYRELAHVLRSEAVTVVNLPASYWHGWVDYLTRSRTPPPANLRLVVVGSEIVSAGAARRWLGLGLMPRLVAAYGLVEATVTSLTYDVTELGVPPDGPAVPLGTPLRHVLARVAADGSDELLLAGPAVFLGYHDDPEQTEARLLADAGGATWMRTGDRTIQDSKGCFHYGGRSDDQVKVSGFRVSVSDVRVVVERDESVREAAIVQPVEGGSLAAAIALTNADTTDAVVERLQAVLPPYAIPSRFRLVPALPRLESGKVDYATIREWFVEAQKRPGAARTPGADDPLAILLDVAGRLLGCELTRRDGFFSAGGNSLLAVRLVMELDLLGWRLELRDVFASDDFTELAARVDPGRSPDAIPARPKGLDCGPLTMQQLSVWYHTHLYPESLAYNAQSRLDIAGPVDTARLREALSRLTRRHEALRTSFHERDDGVPYQVVHESPRIRFNELVRGSGDMASIETTERAILSRRFDLSDAPLAEWTLVREGDGNRRLYVVEHHLIHDGVSFALLMQELRSLLATAPLPGRPMREYLDYALWQDEQIREGAFREAAERWADLLGGLQPLHELVARAQGAGADRTAGVLIGQLDARTAAGAREAAYRHKTTIFVFLLTLFCSVVARHFGQERFAVGVSVANRVRREIARTVGMFVNTVAIPFDATTPTLSHAVQRTHSLAAQAYADQEIPYPVVVRALGPRRVPASTPVYQVTFNFDDAPLPEMQLGEAAVEVIELQSGFAKVDLSLIAVPQREQRLLVGEGGGAETIKLIFQYRRATLADAEARAVAAAFVGEVQSAVGVAGAEARLEMGALEAATEPPFPDGARLPRA